MALEKIQELVARLTERGITVDDAIAATEMELKLLRGLKAMTAAPKEATKPRASRKGGKGEAAAEKGAA